MNTKNIRQTIGEWLEWLIPTLLFLLPVLFAGYYQAADLLGTQQLPQAETLTKWILGLLTLWLTSQGLRTLIFERPGQRLEDKIRGCIKPQSVVFIEKQHYEIPIHLIRYASPGSRIFLTQLGSLPIGDEAEDYQRARDKAIKKNDCYFMRIIAVSSEKNLEELREHLDLCKSFGKYEIRIYKKRCLTREEAQEPRFDMLIIAPSKSYFGYEKEKGIAQRPGAFSVDDEMITGLLYEWFLDLWNMSKPILKNGDIKEAFLRELEEQFQTVR